MKAVLFVAALTVSASALADLPVATTSPAFSKDECSVAYIKPGDQASRFKIFKKEVLGKLHQSLPAGSKSETCNQELRADLKLSAEPCQVFCNPN